jgi:hypothetical protein
MGITSSLDMSDSIMQNKSEEALSHSATTNEEIDNLKSYSKVASLRKGRWVIEEEKYADKLIRVFTEGLLHSIDCPIGTSLLQFLASKLQCSPARIKKRFKNIANQIYVGHVHNDALLDELHLESKIAQASTELNILEEHFIKKIELGKKIQEKMDVLRQQMQIPFQMQIFGGIKHKRQQEDESDCEMKKCLYVNFEEIIPGHLNKSNATDNEFCRNMDKFTFPEDKSPDFNLIDDARIFDSDSIVTSFDDIIENSTPLLITDSGNFGMIEILDIPDFTIDFL